MEFLVEQISRDDNEVLIPTPSLSEIMVKLDPLKIDELLKRLKASQWFRVEGFDAAAAVELAMRTAKAKAAGDKREGLLADHTKIKFDRQIVCIALVTGATEIISDDGDVWAICERWGFPIRSVDQLPLPPHLIPPPLLAPLEDEDDEPQPPATAEDKAMGAMASEGQSEVNLETEFPDSERPASDKPSGG
jgi:hypothetical protein